jgi:hypothetical protein
VYSQLDRVLPAVVNQMDGWAGRFDTGAKLLDAGDDVLLGVGAQSFFSKRRMVRLNKAAARPRSVTRWRG